MTISIERGKKKSKPKSKRPRLGFTNWLAAGLAGGFYLARLSIVYGYTGALACYTAAFAPIGTACSIVLSKIVHKSEVENSGADGEGIKFATAKAHNFCEDGIEGSKESPAI